MAEYKDGNYIVKDGKIYEVQIDIPRMMGAEVIHVALKDFKKPSNADRIRRMSDEELANFLCYLQIAYDLQNPLMMLEWLRKDATSD